MINLQRIHKPRTLDEALELLELPSAVALAGGSGLIADRRLDVHAVVDLGGLGLDYIRDEHGAVAIGATTRLSDLADSPILRATSQGMLARAARESASSLLRNQATIAGTLLVDPAGILAVALIAFDAEVDVLSSTPLIFSGASDSSRHVRVKSADFLTQRDKFPKGCLVTQVVVPVEALSRHAGIETVARTPRDRPIVSVGCSLEMKNDRVRYAALAVGGAAATAVRATHAERILEGKVLVDQVIAEAADAATNGLAPRSDFRGSAEYRREMVRVLVARVLRSVGNVPV